MEDFRNLKTLVVMQLKDKLDLSFTKSARSTLFVVMAKLGQFVLSGGAFFLFFYLASLLKLFSFTGLVPTTLMTAMYTMIFVLAVISCTAGLTDALYLAADNRILLTLPVKPNVVFLSKLVLYYVFELKKNLLLLLPMYVAYGIVTNAAWYFYPWLLLCFVFVSLLPVAIGAALSIPTLFVSSFVKQVKWLQLLLITAVAALVAFGVYSLINVIPENINIAGQWSAISEAVQEALDHFAVIVLPLDKINLMIVGGIRGAMFGLDTLWGVLITLGTIAVCLAAAYLLARPLFFKMASKQFEFEKGAKKQGKNKVHSGKIAPVVYETMRSFRSSRFVIRQLCGLLILPLAIFLQNKTYAAMNTRLSGQYMTIAFTMLVSLLIVCSQNVQYASFLSVDGNARPIAKTQPIVPQIAISSRLLVRVIIMILSVSASTFLWADVAKLSGGDAVMLAFVVLFCGLAHLLWSAEMDVMHSQSDQYATVGVSFDNPNERNSTIIGFLLSGIVAFFLYFLMGEGQTAAILKILIVTLVFLVARVWLFFTRIRLYYAER